MFILKNSFFSKIYFLFLLVLFGAAFGFGNCFNWFSSKSNGSKSQPNTTPPGFDFQKIKAEKTKNLIEKAKDKGLYEPYRNCLRIFVKYGDELSVRKGIEDDLKTSGETKKDFLDKYCGIDTNCSDDKIDLYKEIKDFYDKKAEDYSQQLKSFEKIFELKSKLSLNNPNSKEALICFNKIEPILNFCQELLKKRLVWATSEKDQLEAIKEINFVLESIERLSGQAQEKKEDFKNKILSIANVNAILTNEKLQFFLGEIGIDLSEARVGRIKQLQQLYDQISMQLSGTITPEQRNELNKQMKALEQQMQPEQGIKEDLIAFSSIFPPFLDFLESLQSLGKLLQETFEACPQSLVRGINFKEVINLIKELNGILEFCHQKLSDSNLTGNIIKFIKDFYENQEAFLNQRYEPLEFLKNDSGSRSLIGFINDFSVENLIDELGKISGRDLIQQLEQLLKDGSIERLKNLGSLSQQDSQDLIEVIKKLCVVYACFDKSKSFIEKMLQETEENSETDGEKVQTEVIIDPDLLDSDLLDSEEEEEEEEKEIQTEVKVDLSVEGEKKEDLKAQSNRELELAEKFFEFSLDLIGLRKKNTISKICKDIGLGLFLFKEAEETCKVQKDKFDFFSSYCSLNELYFGNSKLRVWNFDGIKGILNESDFQLIDGYVQKMKKNMKDLDSFFSGLKNNHLVGLSLKYLEGQNIFDEYKQFFKGITQISVISWEDYSNDYKNVDAKSGKRVKSVEGLQVKHYEFYKYFREIIKGEEVYFLHYILALAVKL